LFSSGVGVEALAARYYKRLTKLDIAELPGRPLFVFCATDLIYGVNWEMSQEHIGDYQAGYAEEEPKLNVATAVAASSCFPPVFRPLPLPFASETLGGGHFEPEDERKNLNAQIRLNDGGVYDNMGLEPVWKDYARVLVSDGGAPFGYKESKTILKQIQRSIDVVGKQSVALRKRWLISHYIKKIMQGVYWGIGGAPERYGSSYEGYSKRLALRKISAVRTDMNCFSDAEIAILENHGYLLAEAAIQEHEKELIRTNAPLSIPHPEWMDEGKVEKALAKSHKRITFKRFLDLFKG
jgi:NTE family protein